MNKKRYVLHFPLESIKEPITYYLVKDYDLKINIINADITPGRAGNLLIGLWGTDENIEAGIKYLESRGVRCANVDKRLKRRQELCVHCGSCTGVCFADALTMNTQNWMLEYDPEKCTICGLCVKACPFSVFEIDYEEE